MAKKKGQLVRVVDPETGRSAMVRMTPVHYPMPVVPEYQVPAPRPAYRPPAVRRPRQEYRRPRPRTGRARTVSLGFLFFFLSWIPCAFGAPGGTLLCFGLLASWIIWKAVR